MYGWLTFLIHDSNLTIEKSSTVDKFSISSHSDIETLLTYSYFSFYVPLLGTFFSNTITLLQMTPHLLWYSHFNSLKPRQGRYNLNITSICIKEVVACENKLKRRIFSRSFLLSLCASCTTIINITTIP